ncbi:putative pentatricopeptide repeat-containing protein At3g08820 [Arachis hypogaea]|uniref:putative pentatricopeptide repeat-containing protein At3g08820 n=1 Tax=Arachis hypogaea TaxID=3818 RepID=UPI003B187C22|nr:Putative pentatricopeptide repeat-containing protein [Arachis hypogaea]
MGWGHAPCPPSQLEDLASGEWIDKYITESGFHRNVFVLISLVDMYAKCGSMEKARQLFYGMVERGIICWSAMIKGYASDGLPKEAHDLFFEMQRENLRPDCYAMVGVLSACVRLGALELGNWAKEMLDANEFLLNLVLGIALIDFYAKCGSIAQAVDIFIMMKEKDRVMFNAIIS